MQFGDSDLAMLRDINGPSFADPMEYGMSMDSFPTTGRASETFNNFEFDNGTGIGGGPPATYQDSGSGPPATYQDSGSGPDIPPFDNYGEAGMGYDGYTPPAARAAAPPGQGMVSRGLDAANRVPAWALSSMGPTGVALAGGRWIANRLANRNTGNAEGGMRLEDGAFIVDARTVSEMGNGSSRAGQELLAKHGGKSIHGKGDGVSDSIRASIGGKQEARVARDEVKFSPQAVAKLGGGDRKRGTQKLYAMMDRAANARKNAKRGEDTKLRGLLGA
jgi:hypothetical protein